MSKYLSCAIVSITCISSYALEKEHVLSLFCPNAWPNGSKQVLLLCFFYTQKDQYVERVHLSQAGWKLISLACWVKQNMHQHIILD